MLRCVSYDDDDGLVYYIRKVRNEMKWRLILVDTPKLLLDHCTQISLLLRLFNKQKEKRRSDVS
jgi:hypothetical protein